MIHLIAHSTVANTKSQLAELKGPTVDVKQALYGQAAVGGILGTQLGETPAEATARIEEAKKGATDLTGLVKRKKAKPTDVATPEPTNGTDGKRKAEDDAEDGDHAKKAKLDDGPTENTEAKQAKVEDAAEA